MPVNVEVYYDGENWCARGIGEDIFTQGATVDEVYNHIREGVALHFEDGSHSDGIDILVVTESKLDHAPPSTD